MNAHHVIPLLGITLALASINAFAGKPVTLDKVYVDVTGDITINDPGGGPRISYNQELRSGKETKVTIVTRGVEVTLGFARLIDFFPNKFGPADGAVCFGGSAMASGALVLYDDGTAGYSTYPIFQTADGAELQKYAINMDGTWSGDFSDIPVSGTVNFNVAFNSIDIATEGKGQNRKRSCTGEFAVGVTATVTRP